ncbi:HAD-IA family hydrolase [Pseudobowmanella zhangzhouensis]|nr:hypothetical protein TK45_01775 [Bowmanella sp. JS7-9]
MLPKAVLFDLDGTLLDTARDLGAALNNMLARRGREPVSYAQYRQIGSDGANGMLALGFPELSSTERLALREEFLLEYRQQSHDQSVVFDGVAPLLSWLSEHNILWGIVTNKPEAITRELLPGYPEFNQSAVMVGGDTLSERKPHPAPLFYACEQINVVPQHCWYVGDAERDIIAGNQAGMQTVLAAWGYLLANAQTADWRPTHVCFQPQDLLQLLHSKHNM